MSSRIPDCRNPVRQQVRIGAPDRALTANTGLAAVTELCGRLGVIEAVVAAVGPVKQRARGFGAGQLLAGIAAAQWLKVETGLAAVTARMVDLLPPARAAALTSGPVAAQVAVAQYCPDWWPVTTRLLIRRVRLDPGQVSAGPRSRRRRTLHPDQRALPFPDLATAGAISAYSFILTSLDVSDPGKAVAVKHWYRHRTTVENVFRDGKQDAALRHLPSGHVAVNIAWMWGALLAANMAGWLHQLTAIADGPAIVVGHGVRGGKAMIETLRRRLITVPGRLIRHAGQLILRLPPGHRLLAEILARLRALPATSDNPSPHGPGRNRKTRARRDTRAPSLRAHPKRHQQRSSSRQKINLAGYSRIRV